MHKILLSALFAVVAPTAPLLAQDDAKPATPPIKAEMKKFDKALDAVIDFLEKPSDKAPMAEVAAAQAALHGAKQHPPRITEQQPKDKRAEFVRNYRLAMNKMLRAMLDLEDALLTKDYEAAQKAVDAMVAQKKSGHRTFKGRRRRSSGK
ncbi:MAG: hypothetical protein KAI24_08075 [Planctomycetes bacterium]|nr:hypothetical protein [Planctomycetota bacterium]